MAQYTFFLKESNYKECQIQWNTILVTLIHIERLHIYWLTVHVYKSNRKHITRNNTYIIHWCKYDTVQKYINIFLLQFGSIAHYQVINKGPYLYVKATKKVIANKTRPDYLIDKKHHFNKVIITFLAYFPTLVG